MIELPEWERRQTGQTDAGGPDKQIAAFTEIIGSLTHTVRQLERRLDRLTRQGADRDKMPADEDQGGEPAEPATWIWYPPPAAPEDDPAANGAPRTTVENFVTWYNNTYVGFTGSRSQAIPDCWRQHAGLAMEIATLTYSWRAANIGESATIREAQYWHHAIRPAFAERLQRDWVLSDCLDGQHRADGSGPRPDRFTQADQRPPPEENQPPDPPPH